MDPSKTYTCSKIEKIPMLIINDWRWLCGEKSRIIESGCLVAATHSNSVTVTGNGSGEQHVAPQLLGKDGSSSLDGVPKQQRDAKNRNQRPPPSRRQPDTKPKETLVNGTTA